MRWIVLSLCISSSLVVGCVPRSVHDETRKELERAQSAAADLVRKYNQAVSELQKKEAQLASLDPARADATVRELDAKIRQLEAERSGGARFTAAEGSRVPGAKIDAGGGLALGAALLFQVGSSDLRPEARLALDAAHALIREKPPGTRFIIEGHTDNQEVRITRDRWKHNMRLSFERANAVFEHLLGKGLSEDRMLIRACSYALPVDPLKVDTEEGRRENRRVVIRMAGTGTGA